MSELRNNNSELSQSQQPETPRVETPSENNREKLPVTDQANTAPDTSFRDSGEKGNNHPEAQQANEKDLPSSDPGAKLSPHPSVEDRRSPSEQSSHTPEQHANGSADGDLSNREGVDRLPQRSDAREPAQGVPQSDLNHEADKLPGPSRQELDNAAKQNISAPERVQPNGAMNHEKEHDAGSKLSPSDNGLNEVKQPDAERAHSEQQQPSEQSGEQQPNSKLSDAGKDNIDALGNANEQVDEKKPSFFDRIGNFFHRDSKPQEAEEVTNPQWDGMETAPAPNGSGWTVLPGNHFDQYSDIDKNYEDHPRTAIPKDEQEYKRVNPADIEGVALGDSEVENPDRFWGMHNGSKEDWMNTASQIPEVQQRLDNGESLDSLLDDDQLGRCAQAYFNPDSSKAIEVDEMPDGGYMFNGDGRHRIIAARQAGYDIPVKVVGYRD